MRFGPHCSAVAHTQVCTHVGTYKLALPLTPPTNSTHADLLAGHMVPYVQPERASHLLGMFLWGGSNGDVAVA